MCVYSHLEFTRLLKFSLVVFAAAVPSPSTDGLRKRFAKGEEHARAASVVRVVHKTSASNVGDFPDGEHAQAIF
jgi:hypothetical protein